MKIKDTHIATILFLFCLLAGLINNSDMEQPIINAFEQNQHTCISHKEGDLIIYTCPQCKNYRRTVNWKTGQTIVEGSSNAIHVGSHAPMKASTLPINQN